MKQQRRIIDRKIYKVTLYRKGNELGDVSTICRELSWTVNRNPKIGFDNIHFKIDRVAFIEWCEKRGLDPDEITRPTFTECVISVQHEPDALPVQVAAGYLYDFPTLEVNTEAYDYRFEFIDLAHKLTSFRPISNGTHFDNEPVHQLICELIQKSSVVWNEPYDTNSGHQYNARISRTYDDWKPLGEAISDMLDNTTGAGQFDFWIDFPNTVCTAKMRGVYFDDIYATVFQYPYTDMVDGSLDIIPLAEAPEYAKRDGVITAATVVGSGQGDAAISAYVEDSYAIKKYGYCHAFRQCSSVTKTSTLEQKGRDLIANSLHGNSVASICVNGAYIDWSNTEIGSVVVVHNLEIGEKNTARVDTIEVNCDGNFNESVKLTLSDFDTDGKTIHEH